MYTFMLYDNGEHKYHHHTTSMRVSARPVLLWGSTLTDLEKYHRRQICVCLHNCEQALKPTNILKLFDPWSRCRSHRANVTKKRARTTWNNTRDKRSHSSPTMSIPSAPPYNPTRQTAVQAKYREITQENVQHARTLLLISLWSPPGSSG